MLRKVCMSIGALLILLGVLLPNMFGGIISGSIYNTALQEIKSDYRFFRSNDNNQRYIYTFNIPIKYTTHRVFSLYPNDCVTSITVNNKVFTGLTGDLCNYREGVRLDIGKYLIKGDNTLTTTIDQNGHSKALIIKPSLEDPMRVSSFIILSLGLALVLFGYFYSWFVFDSKKKYRLFWSIVGCMYLIGVIYLLRSEYFQRAHDLTGHLDYIKLLLRGEQMPKSDDCRQCYHSNIYYWISEGIYKISGWIGWADPFDAIRWITSVGRWIGILFGYKILYEIYYIRYNSFLIFLLSAGLFAFWPTQFYYGPKITNDVWHYMFTFISVYYGLKARYAYQDNDTNKIKTYTKRSYSIGLMGLIIKSNSLVWLPLSIIGLLFDIVKRWYGNGWSNGRAIIKKTYLSSIIQLALYTSIVLGGLGWMAHYKGIHGIVDNADRLNNGNSVAYVPVYEAFSSFYVKDFINNAVMRDAKTDNERKSFRGFLSKTMITGEMGVARHKNLLFFSYFMICALIVIVHSIIRFITSKPYSKEHDRYMFCGFIIPIIAMMCYRAIYPLAASMHYRYIYPHLIFFIRYSVTRLLPYTSKQKSLYRSAHSQEKSLLWIDILIVTCLILFIICSIVFSLPPYF